MQRQATVTHMIIFIVAMVALYFLSAISTVETREAYSSRAASKIYATTPTYEPSFDLVYDNWGFYNPYRYYGEYYGYPGGLFPYVYKPWPYVW